MGFRYVDEKVTRAAMGLATTDARLAERLGDVFTDDLLALDRETDFGTADIERLWNEIRATVQGPEGATSPIQEAIIQLDDVERAGLAGQILELYTMVVKSDAPRT